MLLQNLPLVLNLLTFGDCEGHRTWSISFHTYQHILWTVVLCEFRHCRPRKDPFHQNKNLLSGWKWSIRITLYWFPLILSKLLFSFNLSPVSIPIALHTSFSALHLPWTCSPLRKYWNGKTISFVFAIQWRDLGLTSKDDYEMTDQRFSFHFLIFTSRCVKPLDT